MKYLPVIRHIRYYLARYAVNRHYDRWGEMGMLPGNRELDEAVLDAIWEGKA